MRRHTKIVAGVVAAALAIGLWAKHTSNREDVEDAPDLILTRAIQSSSHDYPTVIRNLQYNPSIENADRAISESRTSFVYMFPRRMSRWNMSRRELASQYIRDSADCLDALDKVEGYEDFIAFNKDHITYRMGLAKVLTERKMDNNKLGAMLDEGTRYTKSEEYEKRRARAITSRLSN